MNQFEITLQGLNNYELATINFPCDQDEAAKAICIVSEYGQHDFEIVSYDSDFDVEHLNVTLLNEIAEMPQAKYEAFISFCNAGLDYKEAANNVMYYEYRVFENAEDMSDVAYQLLQDDVAFQEAPSFMRIHFDYDSYGETLTASGDYYEDTENRRIVQLF
ncbi:antirestriction protein ArdA [Priestia megaterium]|uniref:antirestriction protein ArdA n=1 Tax=Priestia megaterium TaxID=1404 RepID=UPI000BFA21F5|nr:antirestriction protein ArdA [Priestia megaterium]PFW43780.1 hypothetical protein COL17_26595 [Priestia megaterium]